MNPTKKSPIFIVGAPRSGTTLLSAMLSNHELLCCGPETQFFNKIDYTLLDEIFHNEDWHINAAKYLNTITLSGQSVVTLFGETVDSVAGYLKSKPPSLTSLLESLCAQYASKNNKAIWVEKTPNHILHLPLIRKLYPEAAIIRIMRDPRDSAHSMMDLPWTSDSYIENSYRWQSWYDESQAFFETDAKVITIKFESLIANAEQTLQSLCDFLGIKMQTSMLDTSKTGQQVSSSAEPWKKQVTGPIDTNRTARWKQKLNKNEILFSNLFFADALYTFGYEDKLTEQKMELRYYPDYGAQSLIDNADIIVKYAKRGIRISSATQEPLVTSKLVLFDLEQGRSLFSKVKLLSFCVARFLTLKTTFYDNQSRKGLFKLVTKTLLNKANV